MACYIQTLKIPGFYSVHYKKIEFRQVDNPFDLLRQLRKKKRKKVDLPPNASVPGSMLNFLIFLEWFGPIGKAEWIKMNLFETRITSQFLGLAPPYIAGTLWKAYAGWEFFVAGI